MGKFPYENITCENCGSHFFDVNVERTKEMQKPKHDSFDGKACLSYIMHALKCSECGQDREKPFEGAYPYIEFKNTYDIFGNESQQEQQ